MTSWTEVICRRKVFHWRCMGLLLLCPALTRPLPECGHASNSAVQMARPISHGTRRQIVLQGEPRLVVEHRQLDVLGHDQCTQRHATGIISVNDERQVKLGRHGDIIDDVDAVIHPHSCMFSEFLCSRACYGHELWQVTVCKTCQSHLLKPGGDVQWRIDRETEQPTPHAVWFRV